MEMGLGAMLGTAAPDEIGHGLDVFELGLGASQVAQPADDLHVLAIHGEDSLRGSPLLVFLVVQPSFDVDNPGHPTEAGH